MRLVDMLLRMERFRGYAVRSEPVTIGGHVYEVLAPADSDALLDDPRVAGRFEQDEYLPYWAMLWPAALLLADKVSAWEVPDCRTAAPEVLELGCGLGLVGLVAAHLGYRVTLSDYDEDALAFAAENARRNGLRAPAVRAVDWRETYDDLRPERIVAADVLYEARHLLPLVQFVRRHLRPGGVAVFSDANRSAADAFENVACVAGLAVTVTSIERPDSSGGKPMRGRIFCLRHAEQHAGL